MDGSVFTLKIGNEGNFCAIGRPARPFVVRVGRVREIASGAFFDRRGKNIAACDEQGAFALWAEAEIFNLFGSGNLRGTHRDAVVGHFNRKIAGLAAGNVKNVQFAVQLIDNLILVVGTGPTDVPLGTVGEPLCFLAARIIRI